MGYWLSFQLAIGRANSSEKAGSEEKIYRESKELFLLFRKKDLVTDGTQHIMDTKEITPLVTSALSQDIKLGENTKLHLQSLKQTTVPMWLSQEKD